MAAGAESIQQMLVHGPCSDIYYSSPENTKKQCVKTVQTTKYQQSLTQLNGGTSVFLIPAAYGIQDIAVTLLLPPVAAGAGAGVALPRGWGYALIRNVSYRIGGSTQFFISGQQLLQHALKRCANATQRDDLFALGGEQLIGAQLEGASNYAYLFMDLPFTKPTSDGKPVPVSSDLLSSQVQITIELNTIASICSLNGGAVVPAAFGNGLASGTFAVNQVLMQSRDDSLASRVNMADHQYVQPVEFLQQEQLVTCANTAGVQTIVATGFRSGSVKSIEMWLTKGSDVSATNKNPLKWYAPLNVTVSYAGDIYARFEAGSSQLWNLINSKLASKVAGLTLSYPAGAYVSTAENYSWVTAPFAQTYETGTTGEYMLTEGINVTNSTINVSFQTPTAAADWTLHLSYVYAASIVYSQSTAEFVF